MADQDDRTTAPPLTLDKLGQLVRDLERTLPPKEESLGCIVVDPWMLGEPMVLTHEAHEDLIRLLFGDSAGQIIKFRKRHLPRLTVVTPRDRWERFRTALLKDGAKEDSRDVWAPHQGPLSFDGAPVYTVQEPPIHSRFLELTTRAESKFFLQHNPSLLLQKLEEARARARNPNEGDQP